MRAVAAHRPSSRSPAAIRTRARRTRASGTSRAAVAGYDALLAIATTSTRSTFRCPTAARRVDAARASPRASTCSARSRSRSRPTTSTASPRRGARQRSRRGRGVHVSARAAHRPRPGTDCRRRRSGRSARSLRVSRYARERANDVRLNARSAAALLGRRLLPGELPSACGRRGTIEAFGVGRAVADRRGPSRSPACSSSPTTRGRRAQRFRRRASHLARGVRHQGCAAREQSVQALAAARHPYPPRATAPASPGAGSPLLFVRQVEDFVAAALDGAPPRCRSRKAGGNAAALAALYRSARDGRPVQL